MTDQLSLYNGACAAMGERQLMSLTESRLARRELDGAWSRGAVGACLEAGMWNFAMRSAAANYDPDITPQFGFQFGYSLPDDFVRWSQVAEDEYFEVPHTRCVTESGFFYSDLQVVYWRWVSNGVNYGMNFSLWPDSFRNYVEHYLADLVVLRVTGNKEMVELVASKLKMWKTEAKSKSAMEESTKFIPPGSWTQSRHGLRTASDGGSLVQLIG